MWEGAGEKLLPSFFFFFKFYFIFKLYITVLDLPNIKMNPSQGLFGEVNGTPLQYSCLENPMDGGA